MDKQEQIKAVKAIGAAIHAAARAEKKADKAAAKAVKAGQAYKAAKTKADEMIAAFIATLADKVTNR